MRLLVVGKNSCNVNAKTVKECEPNDTQAEAQLIQENYETAESVLNGDYTRQYVINGTTKSSDQDWYKVYLGHGKKYLTCNGATPFYYRVINDKGRVISAGQYSKNEIGAKAFEVEINNDAYYYVNIYGATKQTENYLFEIGSPDYDLASVDLQCEEGMIVMSPDKQEKTGTFKGVKVDFPKEAVVYGFQIKGASSIEKIRLKNILTGDSFYLNNYSKGKDRIELLKIPASSDWSAQFVYSRNISFSPKLKIYYVYPVYTKRVG